MRRSGGRGGDDNDGVEYSSEVNGVVGHYYGRVEEEDGFVLV